MFRFLVMLFILVPIIEIAVFIQVGDILGLGLTLFIVIITAILGVNLLKKQGFKAWRDIQLSIAQGNMPAVEMAAAAQLLFAGGLLLTPGFVTDMIGFSLMVPQFRLYLAKYMVNRGMLSAASKGNIVTQRTSFSSERSATTESGQQNQQQGRTIEGEFEEKE